MIIKIYQNRPSCVKKKKPLILKPEKNRTFKNKIPPKRQLSSSTEPLRKANHYNPDGDKYVQDNGKASERVPNRPHLTPFLLTKRAAMMVAGGSDLPTDRRRRDGRRRRRCSRRTWGLGGRCLAAPGLAGSCLCLGGVFVFLVFFLIGFVLFVF